MSDELFRRRGTAWSGPLDAEDISSAATELGAMLAWDETRVADEKRRFEAEWNDFYASPYARQERGLHRLNIRTTGIQQDA